VTERRCWNGCAAEPFRVGNVFCKECYDRCISTGSSRPARPSVRRKYEAPAVKQTISFDDIRAEFEKAQAEE
jgi:hypothetical protein